MIAACLSHVDAVNYEEIRQTLPYCNERRLLDFSELHEAAPIVAARLEAIGKSSPMWRTAADDWKYRITQRLEQLGPLAEALRTAGVQFAAVRSLAVLLAAYPHPEESPMGNFDLLVAPDHVEQAVNVLNSMGFVQSGASGIREFSMELCDDVLWVHVCPQIFRPTSRITSKFAAALTDEIIKTAVIPAGSSCPVPGSEHLLAVLCLDIARRGFVCMPGIRMYAGPDRVIRAFPRLDWERVTQICRGLESELYFALYFTHLLLGTPVPADILTRLQPTKRAFDGVMWCVHRSGFFYPPKRLPALRRLALEFFMRR